jgi:hypothetical protein
MTTQESGTNVTLLVSNQSFDINPVDITILVDGQTVMQDEFDVQGDQPPQHNWRRYHLRLDDGLHSLDVVSKKGRAQLHTTCEVAGEPTVTIAYWYGRRSPKSKPKGYFTVEIGPSHVATM